MSTPTIGRFAPFKEFEYALTGKFFRKTKCTQKAQASVGNIFKLLGNLSVYLLNGGVSLLNRVFRIPRTEPVLGYVKTETGYKEIYRSEITAEEAAQIPGTKEFEEAVATDVLNDLNTFRQNEAKWCNDQTAAIKNMLGLQS